jgi:hypothetical protein
MSNQLGLPVHASARCAYDEDENGPLTLWDMSVGDTTLQSGTLTDLILDGEPYSVWFDSASWGTTGPGLLFMIHAH